MMKPRPSRRTAVLAFLLLGLLGLLPPPAAAQRQAKRYVLVFKAGTSAAEKERVLERLGLRQVEEFPILEIVVAVEKTGGAPAPQGRKPSSVEDVEEDFHANWIPEKKAVEGRASAAPVPWGVERVGAAGVWNRRDPSTMGAGVRVAVIDTGVDCSHPDLKCDLGLGYNALDEEADADDDNGHGTHVAGTIGGKGLQAPDGTYVFGVAPMATLIPIKVLDRDGGGALSDVVRGINWAAASGVDVISMSLGAPKGSKTLQHAIETAYQRGVTIVAAAGNAGPASNSVGYPGAYPQALAIAASNDKNEIADFSSRGPQVAFTAPGEDILSTWPGGGYRVLSGTSMAAPHVSGLAAIAIARGAKGPEGVKAAFASSAHRLCRVDVCPTPELQGRGMIAASGLVKDGGSAFASFFQSQPKARDLSRIEVKLAGTVSFGGL